MRITPDQRAKIDSLYCERLRRYLVNLLLDQSCARSCSQML